MECFGHYDPDQLGSVSASSNHAQWIWVHAVSQGETRTVGILIKQLRASIIVQGNQRTEVPAIPT
nr:glycosyltransferase N-terminal domain-containing protein [Limnohabitans sp. MMS-10A-178]